MKLEIRSILAAGDIQKERLTLRVKADTDIGDYLICQTGSLGDTPNTDIAVTCWLPYKELLEGDLVVVYTKSGDPGEKVLKSGKKAHFYYIGSDRPVWNTANRGALLLYAPNWDFKLASDLVK
ncbi:hypothetical protein LGQ03_15125 [Loktanella sp. TSTF-M6]|uniref:Uncharacterized protein n=1 Tax=Loktanella gaetbuli TaxID=2881335 RepID=A0ABS8BXV6_9RHOB|nr:hypothetical protein [Loktanella gaetbuli]MCB5200572.1 hypothetical protein [Loktanella gaetbuli]